MGGVAVVKHVTLKVGSRVKLFHDPKEILGGELERELCECFEHTNPQHAKLKAMGFPAWKEPRIIKTWARGSGPSAVYSFPRGGLSKVRSVLRRHGVTWSIADARADTPQVEGWPDHQVTLYDYQERLVEAALARENCLVRAPTGSGKTTAAIALAARIAKPTLVIVYNGGLLEQWRERVKAEMSMTAGVIRAGKMRLENITIAMQQTLAKLSAADWERINEFFAVVICDEVQRFAARTFLDVIDRCEMRYRVGVSADETRKDRKEFLVYDLFGDVAAEVSSEELVEREFIHDVEVRVVPTEFRADWYVRARETGAALDFNTLLDEMTVDAARNALGNNYAEAEVNAGEQVLVFSTRVEHCRALDVEFTRAARGSGLLLGGAEWEAEFAATVQAIKTGLKRIGVGTTQAIGQGLDLPSVSRGVVMTPAANNRQQWGQIRGRLCRTSAATKKTDAVLYYLWDQHVFGLAHLRNLKNWNKTVRVLDDDGEWVDVAEYLERRKYDGGATTSAEEFWR